MCQVAGMFLCRFAGYNDGTRSVVFKIERIDSGKGWKANFEYFMNREYAYNRDKGKCKCCGRYFSELIPKHCHHVNPRLPIERINKVPNLAWLCIPCHRMVHNSPIPPELDAKAVRKIKKYREKLKKWNLQVRCIREGTDAMKSVESKSIWW